MRMNINKSPTQSESYKLFHYLNNDISRNKVLMFGWFHHWHNFTPLKKLNFFKRQPQKQKREMCCL